MYKYCLNILLILLCASICTAQDKYWIYFKDKAIEHDIKPHYDYPVRQSYINHLVSQDITPIVKSRWLNAISAHLTTEQLHQLSNVDFIQSVVCVDTKVTLLSHPGDLNLWATLEQINGQYLIDNNLTGKGILIGVIDGGFYNADKSTYLSDITNNESILGYRNFIERENKEPFSGPKRYNDTHGTNVLKYIAGMAHSRQYGLAPEAKFYLARTDQKDREYRGEEDYWVEALEWMYDQGVRLVNSSLGYSDSYDNPDENYSPDDIDGRSSAITQAANIASKKGMIIVLSAGNDGNNDFGMISKPSDAPGIMAVGATTLNYWGKAGYSSIGPEQLDYIKPEVACYSSSGTSFTAPVITGLAACIMQAKPESTNKEVIDAIIRSSHLYPYPNNYIGYGVPDAKKIYQWIESGTMPIIKHELIEATKNKVTLTLESSNITVFHKKNETIVTSQETLTANNSTVVVKRKENTQRATVATPDMVYEIIWP